MSDYADALPSHDLQAEQAVLGSMMMSPDVLAECLDMLTLRAFHRPAHQIIFSALQAIADNGEPADALTVKAELERRGEITRISGPLYLTTLLEAVPVAANGPYYARKLLDHQARRDVEELAGRVATIARAEDMTAQERFDAVYAAADEASGVAVIGDGAATAASAISSLLDLLEEGPGTVTGVPTAWPDVNAYIPGFRAGEITVVGGRPGMGKSVVLLNVAAHAAMNLGLHVLAITLEMSRDEYLERLLAAEAEVNLGRIRERQLTPGDWDRIAKASPRIYGAETLHIHEGPRMSVQGIRAELRAMRRAGTPAALVAVDYLQLMDGMDKPESRQIEVSQMSRSLKLLAKEFGVPVLVGSQLNRGPELRMEHRPLLADLRESGAVENDADIVILLYRDEVYNAESPRAGEIEFIVAKNRQGRKGTVSLAFRGDYAKCNEMAKLHAENWTPAAALGEEIAS